MNNLTPPLSQEQKQMYKIIFEKISVIEEFPGMHTCTNNFSELAYFLKGYITALENLYHIEIDFLNRFELFLRKEYNDISNSNWIEMILYYGYGEKYAHRDFYIRINLFKYFLMGVKRTTHLFEYDTKSKKVL